MGKRARRQAKFQRSEKQRRDEVAKAKRKLERKERKVADAAKAAASRREYLGEAQKKVAKETAAARRAFDKESGPPAGYGLTIVVTPRLWESWFSRAAKAALRAVQKGVDVAVFAGPEAAMGSSVTVQRAEKERICEHLRYSATKHKRRCLMLINHGSFEPDGFVLMDGRLGAGDLTTAGWTDSTSMVIADHCNGWETWHGLSCAYITAKRWTLAHSKVHNPRACGSSLISSFLHAMNSQDPQKVERVLERDFNDLKIGGKGATHHNKLMCSIHAEYNRTTIFAKMREFRLTRHENGHDFLSSARRGMPDFCCSISDQIPPNGQTTKAQRRIIRAELRTECYSDLKLSSQSFGAAAVWLVRMFAFTQDQYMEAYCDDDNIIYGRSGGEDAGESGTNLDNFLNEVAKHHAEGNRLTAEEESAMPSWDRELALSLAHSSPYMGMREGAIAYTVYKARVDPTIEIDLLKLKGDMDPF